MSEESEKRPPGKTGRRSRPGQTDPSSDVLRDDPIEAEFRELEGAAGGPSDPRRVMTYEMVEQGPLAVTAVGRMRSTQLEIEDPDREIVDRWQAGDLSAFEELVKRHERKIFRLLLRMMGSREEAEDVAQETFLSLHRHGHRFRSEARFSTFLYRVAVNAALNRRRALGRKRARIQRLGVRQSAGDDLPVSPRGPEDAADGGEVTQAVRRALDALSPALRMPVVLYDIEGLAYGEIARILGVAEGTVKSRIHRARLALREELRELVTERNGGSVS